MKDNYTWNKPSRAGIANGLILPSTSTTPKLHVAVAVDTSGSIGNPELELLMNHVFTILSQFKHFTVDLWCCSTHVHEDTFTTYTASNKSKLSEFKIQSDGGTDMSKNLEFIDKKYAGNKPDVVMIFTDGFDSLSGDTETRTSYPIVWLIVDNKAFVKPAHIPGAVYPFETH
jgi:predicted metal-dependent peptidase